ncbi:MAG: hypothetical protein IPI03_19360 [Rubrivivax sp.]|nr:hypothetical protein [Rubrivivax sp.]
MRSRIIVLLLSVLGALLPTASLARDLHEHWDSRCKSCHGDSAAFARSTLRVEQGRLLGRHHVADLPKFLHNHHLADDLVAPVSAMLMAQVNTKPLFKTHCAGCHDSAAALARRSLLMHGAVLTGKINQRPVADFLRRHGGLAATEVAPMVTTLRRVLAEIGGGG